MKLTANVRARHSACWICRQPIDYTIEDHNDPKAFTVDHVKSWLFYPELRTDPRNLRAAHKGCNSSKGNREDKPDLGSTSRQW